MFRDLPVILFTYFKFLVNRPVQVTSDLLKFGTDVICCRERNRFTHHRQTVTALKKNKCVVNLKFKLTVIITKYCLPSIPSKSLNFIHFLFLYQTKEKFLFLQVSFP
jgi:hypothetical protein